MILLLCSCNNIEDSTDRSAVDDTRCLIIMEEWLVKYVFAVIFRGI